MVTKFPPQLRILTPLNSLPPSYADHTALMEMQVDSDSEDAESMEQDELGDDDDAINVDSQSDDNDEEEEEEEEADDDDNDDEEEEEEESEYEPEVVETPKKAGTRLYSLSGSPTSTFLLSDLDLSDSASPSAAKGKKPAKRAREESPPVKREKGQPSKVCLLPYPYFRTVPHHFSALYFLSERALSRLPPLPNLSVVPHELALVLLLPKLNPSLLRLRRRKRKPRSSRALGIRVKSLLPLSTSSKWLLLRPRLVHLLLYCPRSWVKLQRTPSWTLSIRSCLMRPRRCTPPSLPNLSSSKTLSPLSC